MDNNLIKKVMTFKSGNFVFSAKYDASALQNLLFEARLLYKTIADLPVLPEWSSYLEEELIRRSIFSTAAIEGNPLKEAEVDKIIKQKEEGQKKESEAQQAIINLKAVYGLIKKIEPLTEPPTVTEDFIQEAHRIITTNLDYTDNLPGKYRDHIVKVGDDKHGGIYTPPKCYPDIEKLMKEFVEWINCREIMELDSFLRAALAHYHLGLIHPFGNGNGRTIRIIEARLLRTSGVKYVPTMLSNYYYRKIDDYYFAFSHARKNADHDITSFLKFMIEGVIESLNEIRNNVTNRIRGLLMRDYCAFLKTSRIITERQYDLLFLLLGTMDSISLKDLFNVPPYSSLYRNVSERTARRDLSKLVKVQTLSFSHDKGTYTLDLKALR